MVATIFGLPPSVSQRTKRAVVVGGLGYISVLLASWVWAYGPLSELGELMITIQVGPWLWWAFLGGASVGSVLVVFLVRDGLVSPLLSVVGVYLVAMYQMWQAMQAPEPMLPGTPFDLYLVGWPLLLGLALAAGFIERRVRTTGSMDKNPDVT